MRHRSTFLCVLALAAGASPAVAAPPAWGSDGRASMARADQGPECKPDLHLAARPGATRRFEIWCEDPGGQAVTEAFVATPPDRGTVTLTEATGDARTSASSRLFYGVYTPDGDSLQRDELTIGARGAEGEGAPARIVIAPRPLEQNGHGWCSGNGFAWDVMQTLIRVICWDEEGDPVTVTEVGAPAHGRIGSPTTSEAPWGVTRVDIPYTADGGFEGEDTFTVTASDGHGATYEAVVKVTLYVYRPPPPGYIPPGSSPPSTQGPAGPASVLPPAISAAQVRAAAVQAVGGRVEPVTAPAGVEVWAAARMSRRALLRHGRSAGMVVFCREGCTLTARTGLVVKGRTSARPARLLGAIAIAPNTSRVVSVALTRAQRRSLRRTRRATAGFRLTVRSAGGAQRSIRRSIRVGA